jgi:hypothetical protein
MSDKAQKAKQAAAALYRRNAARGGSLCFTKETSEALTKILLEAGATDDASIALLREVEYAFALYPQGDERLSVGEAKERIRAFIDAANAFAAAWGALGENLQHSVCAEDIGSQALGAAFCAELFEGDIGDAKAHNPAGYRFVLTVADLWARAGVRPTFTNTISARTGAKMLSPFERFIALAAPDRIAPEVVRQVVVLVRNRLSNKS